MPTLVLHPHSLAIGSPGEAWAVLCSHCERQRSASINGPELVALGLAVVSGCCHDCGAGYCMCRGTLPCELCPRKNSPVIVEGLTLYRLDVPPPASTRPALGGDDDDRAVVKR